MGQLRVKLGAVVIILAVLLVMVVPVAAWSNGWGGGHQKITDLSLTNKTIPSVWTKYTISDAADDPDGWTINCKPHSGSNLQVCTSNYAVPTVYQLGVGSSGSYIDEKEFGYATHFLADAGQPYHAKVVLNDYHYALEAYAFYFVQKNCSSVQSAMQTASTIAVPNTGSTTSALRTDIRTHVANLINFAKPYYNSIDPLVRAGYVKPSATMTVKVCGQNITVGAGTKIVDENKLSSTQISNLRSYTKTVLVKTASYIKGLIDLEGPGKRQPNVCHYGSGCN